jgi:membrane-bound ClpP family serine protease
MLLEVEGELFMKRSLWTLSLAVALLPITMPAAEVEMMVPAYAPSTTCILRLSGEIDKDAPQKLLDIFLTVIKKNCFRRIVHLASPGGDVDAARAITESGVRR